LESGDIFPIGVTDVTMEATNTAGVTSQVSFTVEVFDDVDPVAVCNDLTGFDCTDVGTQVVTLTVTEVLPASSTTVPRTDTCTATITIEDNEFPVLYPVASYSIDLDLITGDGTILYTDLVTALATDNCGIAAEMV